MNGQKLPEELAALEEKINHLQVFSVTEKYEQLTAYHRTLLQAQLTAMTAYSSFLRLRIDDMTAP